MSQVWRDVSRAVSVPTGWLVGVAAVAVAIAAAAGLTALGAPPSPAAALLLLPGLSGLFGALIVGADFRFGSVTTELMLVGGIRPFLRRSFVAVALPAVAIALVSLAAADLVWSLAGSGLRLTDVSGVAGAAAIVAACWAAVGIASAVLARGQIPAVVGLLVYLMVVEPMLEAAAPGLHPWLPGRLSALALGSGLTTQSVPSLALLAAYGSAGLVLAGLTFRSRGVHVINT